MGKYTAPLVSMGDVAVCLPALEQPAGWRIAFYPKPGNSTSLLPTVELVVNRLDGSTWVYKRWGRPPRTSSTPALMAALLQAAHEAHWWCEGRSTREITNLARWEADAAKFKA